MERVPYILPLVLYAALSFAHLLPGVWPVVDANLRRVTLIAALLHAIALAVSVAFGDDPAGFPEALSGAALGVVIAYGWTADGRLRALGMLLVPLATVLLGTSLVVPHRQVVA